MLNKAKDQHRDIPSDSLKSEEDKLFDQVCLKLQDKEEHLGSYRRSVVKAFYFNMNYLWGSWITDE